MQTVRKQPTSRVGAGLLGFIYDLVLTFETGATVDQTERFRIQLRCMWLRHSNADTFLTCQKVMICDYFLLLHEHRRSTPTRIAAGIRTLLLSAICYFLDCTAALPSGHSFVQV